MGLADVLVAKIDKFLQSRLDALVSSRADGSVYTATRGAKLDNLDALISSRLASTDSRLSNLDHSLSGIDTDVVNTYNQVIARPINPLLTTDARLSALANNSIIKTLQRGSIALTSNQSGGITISSVNTIKSIVLMNYTGNYNSQAIAEGVTLTLTNPTTLTWTSNVVYNGGTLIWQVIEFN